MERTSFLKILSRELYPVLREEGFIGSGTTLRRIAEPVVHVFNFQGSTSARSCYFNLGAHLGILDAEGTKVDLKSILEYECAFRMRIDPPAHRGREWSYGSTANEAQATVHAIRDEWVRQGQAFFLQFSSYPESFITLVENTRPYGIHPGDCETFAKIALQLGLVDRAMEFVRAGLERVSPQATGLRADLLQLQKQLKPK